MVDLNKYDFVKTKHGDIWKYLISADNAILAAKVYKLLITECLKNKTTTIEKILSGNIDTPEYERKSFVPDGTIQIGEERIEFNTLIYVYTTGFFQECRNFFDYIAQVIVPLFAIDEKKYNNISFSTTVVNMDFGKQDDISKYVKKISESNEYRYLCDYNNTVKHNYNLGITGKLDLSDYTVHVKVPKFERKGKKYSSEDLENIMKKMYEFINSLFIEFSDLVQSKIDSQKEELNTSNDTSTKE